MDSLPLNLDELKRLIALFDEHRLNELELRESGVRVRLEIAERRAAVQLSEAVPLFDETGETLAVGTALAAPALPHEPTPEEKGWIAIPAPMTGTFYRTPGPNEPNFIEVGSIVEADQAIGLIEAMKIFSEIHTETAGTVVEIPAQSGQMVQPGQVLAWILPD